MGGWGRELAAASEGTISPLTSIQDAGWALETRAEPALGPNWS